MNLANIWEKVKTGEQKWGIGLLFILIAGLAFGLGRLSNLEQGKESIKFETWATTSNETQIIKSQTDRQLASPVDLSSKAKETKNNQVGIIGNYVASKNGNKYHLPWCPGAKRIKPENQIWFATKEEAVARGYSPAANCPGL